MVRQFALRPQFASEQGSIQRLFLQAFESSQSELVTHSGRQEGGEPVIVGRHEQIGWSFRPCLHCEFGPHGEG
jgi:hypothetical protein